MQASSGRHQFADYVEQTRELSPIEETAGEYTDLRPSGTTLRGICPLPSHTETAPSFTVYPESQSFYCYGCHRGGDVFNLVMSRESLNFLEAVRFLASRANIAVEQLSEVQVANIKHSRAIGDTLTLATEYYHQLLTADTHLGMWCRSYLQKRGITAESMIELRLGASSGSGLLVFLYNHGISEELARKAGLVSERSGKLKEFLYGRIVFPCLSNGRAKWIIGRSLGGAKPKYLGLPTSKSPYASTLRQDSPGPILVEGPTDAIVLWQWGYSTVALLGTAINKEWLPVLKRFDNLYLCMDTDNQGINAALVHSEKLFPKAKTMWLPSDVKDPSEFVEKGHSQEEFGDLLAQACDFIEYELGQIDPDVDKLRLPDELDHILELLAKLDPAKADAYLRYRIKPRFHLKQEALAPYRSCINQRRKNVPPKRRFEKAATTDVHAQSEIGTAPAVREQRVEEGVDMGGQKSEEKAAALSLKANELLCDPALLYKAGRALKRLGVAGEDVNIRLLYLAVTSRIVAEPISITLKGDSSSGKSYVVGKVLSLFPSAAYIAMTGMSRQALVYREESFAHKTIVVYEQPGMNAADYNIRTLQSEGKIIFETVQKDTSDDSHYTERIEKEGPTNFILTTTSPELNPENETRHWTLVTDESPQTTLAAKVETAKRYEHKTGLSQEEIDVWRQVQLELKPIEVCIPYARWLAQHTTNTPLRIRRDFNRLLAMIEVTALLYQKQRRISEGDILEAGLSDYFMARGLIEQVFPASLTGINKKVESLVSMVEQVYQEKLSNGEQDPVVKPKEIVKGLGTSSSSISRWLKPAINADLVEVVTETVKGRITSVKPGLGERCATSALPTVEELAESFPELARGCKVVHPITGEELGMEEASAVVEVGEKSYTGGAVQL